MIPAAFVIIDSYSSDDVIRLVISEEDRTDLKSRWHDTDPVLSRLHLIPWLQAIDSWDRLNRMHIQMLIAIHLTLMNDSPQHDHIVTVGLKLAIIGLLLNLEEETGWVSQLRIKHLGSLHLEVDVMMTIASKIEVIEAPRPGIRVVVNNIQK